jgi:hypothetical protein
VRPSLFPSSYTCSLVRSSHESPAARPMMSGHGRGIRLTTFPQMPTQSSYIAFSWLGSAYPPVVLFDDVSPDSTGISDHGTFWLRPVSSFGLSIFTGVQPTVHFRYPYSTHLAPQSLLLGFSTDPLAWCQHCIGRGTLSSELHTSPLPAKHVQVGDGRSCVRS